jgi:hypothetical protein
MFAGGVGDLATSIGTPGTDAMPASEKAVRDVLAECAPAASGVTNGDSHDHSGGDGAQIDHGSLGGRADDDHSIYYNQARGDARYAQLAHAARHASGGADAVKLDDLAAPDDNTDLNATVYAHGLMSKEDKTTLYTHANRHQWGGADAVKLDDLAAPDDNTDLNASTSKHGLMQKYPNTAQALKGDGSWLTRYFEIDFPFGNGQDVIENFETRECSVPVNCKIVRMDLWEVGLNAGYAKSSVYIHDLGADKGSIVLNLEIAAGNTYNTATGLSTPVSANKIIRADAGITTTAKHLVLRLVCEAT